MYIFSIATVIQLTSMLYGSTATLKGGSAMMI